MKKYTLNDINCILIDYINENKNKNNIDYLDTIETFKGLLEEIEHEYIDFKIEELKKQLDYEEKRIEVCGYGKSDLYHIEVLKCEIEDLENR